MQILTTFIPVTKNYNFLKLVYNKSADCLRAYVFIYIFNCRLNHIDHRRVICYLIFCKYKSA